MIFGTKLTELFLICQMLNHRWLKSKGVELEEYGNTFLAVFAF